MAAEDAEDAGNVTCEGFPKGSCGCSPPRPLRPLRFKFFELARIGVVRPIAGIRVHP